MKNKPHLFCLKSSPPMIRKGKRGKTKSLTSSWYIITYLSNWHERVDYFSHLFIKVNYGNGFKRGNHASEKYT